MIKNKTILALIIITLLAVLVDILVRMFYCQGINLLFNSQEFNNIASPLISFFGFVGLIITIVIALNQIKHKQSSSYFDYYKGYINKFLIEKDDRQLDTIALLKFAFYTSEKYDELKKFPEYLSNLKSFNLGENISSNGKDYDGILANVRYFRAKLAILLKRYEFLLDEILSHKHLSKTHKDLLLKEFFENQITEYTVGLQFVDLELSEVKENLYIAFVNYGKDKLPFYNTDLYELKKKVEADIRLEKYLENNAH